MDPVIDPHTVSDDGTAVGDMPPSQSSSPSPAASSNQMNTPSPGQIKEQNEGMSSAAAKNSPSASINGTSTGSAGDQELFYLKNPRQQYEEATANGSESPIGTVRPSTKLIIPSLALYLLVGVALTYTLFIFSPHLETTQFAQQNPMWVLISLAVIWLGSMAPVFWEYLKYRTTSFTFTPYRIFYNYGVFNRENDQVEIARIRDVSYKSPFWQRPFGLSYVTIHTIDKTHPKLVIEGQINGLELKDWVHALNILERERIGYKEFNSGQIQ